MQLVGQHKIIIISFPHNHPSKMATPFCPKGVALPK